MKKILATLMIFSFLVGCNTTVNQGMKETELSDKSQEITVKDGEIDPNHKIEDEPYYGKTIPVGYTGGLCTSAPALADELGYYDEEGLDVEIINVQSKVDAIGTGQVVQTTDHIATLLVPAVNGIDMEFLAGAHTGCKSLYVLSDSEVENTSDLVGKSVAIPDGFGNSDHNIALRFFNHDSIDPNEIKFKQVETSAVIQSMQSGEIQAAVLSDQYADGFVEDGTLKIIRSLTWDDDFKVEPCCVHAFNKEFVKENPLIAEKMVSAIRKASEYFAENHNEAVEILQNANWASGDYDLVVKMSETYNWKVTNDMSKKALEDIIDDYKTFGLIDADKDTEEILNNVWSPVDVY